MVARIMTRVSIPSQAGILLADQTGTNSLTSGACRLNTLSGGHPLGGLAMLKRLVRPDLVSIPSQAGILLAGRDRCQRRPGRAVSIPSQAGILLAGGQTSTRTTIRRLSQYPLRRASSWRISPTATAEAMLPTSQYPLRRASSWRRAAVMAEAYRHRGLNTLSGGHPLGGWYSDVSPSWTGRQSQYPLRRASSWRRTSVR